jgi:hypothetical protein
VTCLEHLVQVDLEVALEYCAYAAPRAAQEHSLISLAHLQNVARL